MKKIFKFIVDLIPLGLLIVEAIVAHSKKVKEANSIIEVKEKPKTTETAKIEKAPVKKTTTKK